MKEILKKIYKKSEKRLGANTGKIVTVILFGILLLVVVIPADGCGFNYGEEELNEDDNEAEDNLYATGLFLSNSTSSTEEAGDALDEAQYYEARLRSILESSYGAGSVSVMIHMTDESEKGLYGDTSSESVIDGVLVVADVENVAYVLEISEAVCALFNLPAYKVYVIKKS